MSKPKPPTYYNYNGARLTAGELFDYLREIGVLPEQGALQVVEGTVYLLKPGPGLVQFDRRPIAHLTETQP